MKDGRPTVCFPWKSETPQQLFALTRMVQRSSEAPVVFPVLELASWICGEIPTLEGGPPSPAMSPGDPVLLGTSNLLNSVNANLFPLSPKP